jgi:hypothetical protein
MLTVAVAVLAADAAALLAATVLNVIDLATNQTYQISNGVALIVLQVIMIAGLAWLASGVARVRPWTRTPSVMVQVLIGIVAIILLQGHRYDWGVPTLLLALAGLAGLLNPASLRALARPMPEPEPEPLPKKQPPAKRPSGKGKSGNPAKRDPASVSRRS